MTTTKLEDIIALEALETRLRAILPEQYQNSYEEVLPVSMGSASLKYGLDGRVAWNEIWATFCDLAMAGGPPHRGRLLEPASLNEIATHPHQYDLVVEEICRGIAMVTSLQTEPLSPGWISLPCNSFGMAAWLVRAIVMENVLARQDGQAVLLPVGPEFRLEKEIKNVVTVVAKTCHYWNGHVSASQQQSIEQLFITMDQESELLTPASSIDTPIDPGSYQALLAGIAEDIRQKLNLGCFTNRYWGWIGVECPSVYGAVWLMRAMVGSNVAARREDVVLFLPVNPAVDPDGKRLTGALASLYHLASIKKVL